MNAKQFESKLKNIIKKYDTQLNEVVRIAKTPAFLNPIAVIAADLMRKRTRLGYGVDRDGAERTRLKALSQSYIDYRAGKVYFYKQKKSGKLSKVTKNVRKPVLHELTRANKSNLTFTGQLLDAIKGRSYTGGIIIYLNNKRRGETITNAEIKDYQEKQGRSFFYLSRTENINVNREYRLRFYELLKSRSILVR